MKRLSYDEFEEKLEKVKILAHQSFLASMGIEDCSQSIHGLKHWKSVETNGILLSHAIQIDEQVVRLFAYLHDCIRHVDGQDIYHGQRSSEFVLKLSKQGILDFLSISQLHDLHQACYNHHQAKVDRENRTIGACYDADRLDLIRVNMIPNEDLMSTYMGRWIARLYNYEVNEPPNLPSRTISILKTIPAIEKTSEILKLFTGPLQRPKLDNYLKCTTAHGTTLSAVLSALINSNGNLVTIQRMQELHITKSTGCTPELYLKGDSTPTRKIVCGADLSFGAKAVETASKYAKWSSGIKLNPTGTIEIQDSFAARIPAVVLGEHEDTEGVGKIFVKAFMNPENYGMIQPRNPLYGLSDDDILDEFVDQVAGDKLIIRKILVENPDDPNGDAEILTLVKTLVECIVMALKQDQSDIDYSDITIGLMRDELVSFKEIVGSRRDVSREEIIAHFFNKENPKQQEITISPNLGQSRQNIKKILSQNPNNIWHINPTKTPQQPPRHVLILKFRCSCGKETAYPEHCGEHMEYDFESKKLQCKICQTTASIPIHHDEEMKVFVHKT